ncbi:MAG: NAD(P)H-binding protein [Ignavibacteriaceae bacterium]|nr:NAD(P)H-binding protein [Ignavibacteriaceae bacterium]HRQ55468.1 NAD(P)H-binding protein [Ignavibacteriaceae bacterium]
MKTAIVIGATGLVGSYITLKLLDDSRYSKVKVFVRNSLEVKHPKLEEHIVDFEKLDLWKDEIKGDELYSALGTTIKKAGSKNAQYKIDFTYQYETAKAAAKNGVKSYMLISSAGANYKSSNFYLRMKGNLDEKVQLLNFKKIRIFRPSILVGLRSEKRVGESIGIKIAGLITRIIPALKRYKPIKASIVAEAMIISANQNKSDKIKIYHPEEIFILQLT